MRELVLKGQSYSETEQAEIRGISVNFFNKLESLLSSSLKLGVWALYRDHYGSIEGFSYSEDAAVEFCAAVLSSKQTSIEYKSNGAWTLYPLIRGFDILANLLEDLNPEQDRRPETEYPRILRKGPNPFFFAFRHKHAFSDLSEASKADILSTLRQISRTLSSAKVDTTRNSLDHNNPFPGQSSMLTAIDAAESAVGVAESSGLLPLTVGLKSDEKDEFGRRSLRLATARGRVISITRPALIFITGMPGLYSPQIAINKAVFESSNEVLRLKISNRSSYASLWSDFPRRRSAVPGSEELSAVDLDS
jgi:hypothetical protein